MMRGNLKQFLILFLIGNLLTFPAYANSSIENFTRNMVKIYVVSVQCRHHFQADADYYISTIKDYLHMLYINDLPYWVLPEVNGHIKNREDCIFLFRQHLLYYEQDRNIYSASYPEQPEPPLLPASYIEYAGKSRGGNSAMRHTITPHVVAGQSGR